MIEDTFLDINNRFIQLIERKNYANGLDWEINLENNIPTPNECYKVHQVFISDIKIELSEVLINLESLAEDLYDKFLDFTKKMGYGQIWFQQINFVCEKPGDKEAFLVILFQTINFSKN